MYHIPWATINRERTILPKTAVLSGCIFGPMLMRITPRREPEPHMQVMRNYQENIGRAGIVAGLMIVAVFAAVIAQGRNQTLRPLDEQLVVIDGVATATGE